MSYATTIENYMNAKLYGGGQIPLFKLGFNHSEAKCNMVRSRFFFFFNITNLVN